MGFFRSIEDMLVAASESIRPPERLSVSEAAAKYRKLNNVGSYQGDWLNEKTPYLVDPMNVLQSRNFTGMVFVGPAQAGKRLALDTVVPTPAGKVKFGELRVGDEVFGSDGFPCRVTFVSEIAVGRPTYRVTFDDGSTVVADDEHNWPVCDMWNRDPYKSVLKTTSQMADSYEVITSRGTPRYRYSIWNAKSVQMPRARLPIDPYVFGVWLGDGARQNGGLTLFEDDASFIVAEFESRGYLVDKFERDKHKGEDYRAYLVRCPRLNKELRANGFMGAKTKWMPEAYLRASEPQRRSLLQGLMDTDGGAEKGRCSFSTSFEDLAPSVYELMVSLGLKVNCDQRYPTYSYKGKRLEGKLSYRFTFTTDKPWEVFKLSRHIKALSDFSNSKICRPTHSGRRFIRSIERVKSVPGRCITVDSVDHTYLVSDSFIVTHNTDMLLNWITHSVVCDPMDMMVVQMSQSTARDFSKRRMDKLFRDTTAVGERRVPGRQNRNVYDTRFTSGMYLTTSWPTINELSGKPIPRLWLTDYDRMPEDVDKNGAPFDLARKRATTFKRFGMCVAESSPSRPVTDTKWKAKTPHEAPPTTGILSLYNRGDRRRFFWSCPHCGFKFEPHFKHMNWNTKVPILEAAEGAYMVCPGNGCVIEESDRYAANLGGRWIAEGQRWLENGDVEGEPLRSDIASFWLMGPAAGLGEWRQIVANYLSAEEEFEKTGSQDALKTTINVDQALPYIPKGMSELRLPEKAKEKELAVPIGFVPGWVRFLMASVDVQKNRFEVQVHGIGVNGDMCVIDRFQLKLSNRIDPSTKQNFWISPHSYLEDWDLLIEGVIKKTYPIHADPEGRHMMLKAVGCDSGGREGVTMRAYDFWRSLRDRRDEFGDAYKRFQLVKGEPKVSAPTVQLKFPDSERKDRKAGARGEVPILFINSNVVKDQLDGMMGREVSEASEGGLLTFCKGFPDSFYVELTREVRMPKGWENPGDKRNESWDLLVYALGLMLSGHARIRHINWDDPPGWAKEYTENDLVFTPVPSGEARFAVAPKVKYDLEALGEELG